ncbi:hypothetical protein [Aeromicrobium sp. CF3.5]|uniref:hypothetical protein n=1 Tax=Aeromicrobium sp. CF3.5 TaxID=3373078 RepID=UPI003EE7F45F
MVFRPALRPGSVVLRRDARHLQVGTSPGIIVRDRPGLHRLLLLLDGLHDSAWWAEQVPDLDAPVHTVLSELTAAGAIVDASSWRPARAVAEARHLAATGRHPDALARRARLRVSLHHDGGTGDLAALTAAVLVDAGVTPTEDLDADLVILMCTGEPARAVVEEAVRCRVRHLLVRVEESRAQIGPLVTPGVTPCLGCHDLHRSVWDPGWGALVPQFGRRATAHNPPALGAVLPHIVVGEIVQVVLVVADQPSAHPALDVTCLGPGTADRRTWAASFHHRCSCALLPAA